MTTLLVIFYLLCTCFEPLFLSWWLSWLSDLFFFVVISFDCFSLYPYASISGFTFAVSLRFA